MPGWPERLGKHAAGAPAETHSQTFRTARSAYAMCYSSLSYYIEYGEDTSYFMLPWLSLGELALPLLKHY